MSFWKVIGGAAAGIACVVALPIAGPVGAITAAGAAIAGGVGAAAGGVAAAMDDGEEEAERRGERRANAEQELKYSKLTAAFEDAKNRLDETENYFNLLIAMEAVGLACANCDGEISLEERQEIDEFIAGVSSSELPSHVKRKIEDMAKNPPNVNTAFALAQKVGLNSFELYNEIIEVVMHADGRVHENEKAFEQAWNTLVKAA
ncbi:MULTISPECIES: hypothetical protein [unclassified Photobacterium]|uniref:hypothetical protein n=1 Tax=unclassified Photobacterium TaxID=2628852 RepID=UPI000D16B90D|nr:MULTISPECIES: hypothetical protein [unclassified Photobacterium]PSV27527.1 hypothetical protein C9J42_07780 [Photobacterium sp. GB-56]PSV34852.1 hypothetical protein C9J38_16990 [Photobacterium sp. GB-210]